MTYKQKISHIRAEARKQGLTFEVKSSALREKPTYFFLDRRTRIKFFETKNIEQCLQWIANKM